MFRIITAFIIAVSLVGCIKNPNLFPIGFKAKPKNQSRLFNQDEDDDQESVHESLLDPSALTEQAPDEFKVNIATTKGDIVLKVTRDWSPNAADRFYNMVKAGYFNDIAIFRAIEGFMFQFGVHGNTKVSKAWRGANFKDDPIREDIGNEAGYISFAHTGAPNSRSVQMFINLADNRRKLDHLRFTPFGKVVEGMDVVGEINTEYGENRNGEQGKLQRGGNDFIREFCPNIDFIESITFIEEIE